MNRSELAAMIDHTALKPDATDHTFTRLAEEAIAFGFAAVCVPPSRVSFVADRLTCDSVKVATVIGFPHGNTFTEVKAFEAEQSILAGARELDMVIAISELKSGDQSAVARDIDRVVATARSHRDVKVKVILETALLTIEEKELGCRLAMEAGADFVKTSTGFASEGATVSDIALFRRIVGDRLGIKASGGIRDAPTAIEMINAGATRLGSSSSVSIVMGIPE